MKVKHDVVFSVNNDENANNAYEDVLRVLDKALKDSINSSGRLSYAFPPFICILKL